MSTLKKDAEELITKFQKSELLANLGGMDHFVAVECAIKSVDIIIEDFQSYRMKHYLTTRQANELSQYWKDLRAELEKRTSSYGK